MDNFTEFETPANIPSKEAGSIISHALEIFKNTFLYCFLAVVIYFLLSYLIQPVTGFNSTMLMEEIKERGNGYSYNDLIATPGVVAYGGVSFFVGLLLAPIFVGLIYSPTNRISVRPSRYLIYFLLTDKILSIFSFMH